MKIASLTSRIALFLVVVFTFTQLSACAQNKRDVATIAFYNLENLYDTIDDPRVNDNEFLPDGTSNWTSDRYETKLSNMAHVISDIGKKGTIGSPSLVGVAEVENRQVLEDLVNNESLRNSDYGIVHYDSPDKRGIDVGLLYKKADFSVINSTSNRLNMPGRNDFYSRDQLVVSGKLGGELVHLIVNHWPSRASGPEYREAAAMLTLALSDSIKRLYPKAKIIILGDLNDDPKDRSVYKILGAKGKQGEVRKSGFYNPMWQIHDGGTGTLVYKNAWNLFDQIIVSAPLLNARQNGWKFLEARVYDEIYVLEQEGKYAGYPLRTYAGGAYTGGYSDHLPTYIYVVKSSK